MMKFPLALLALALPGIALAQAPQAGKNLIYNGSFEKSFQSDNLWDGIDNEGFLAGQRGSVRAVTESGTFDSLAMTVSVSAVDFNGDGLIDIAAADTENIIRVYFNSGTPTEPAFTQAETVPVFLAFRPTLDNSIRKSISITATDLGRNGVQDFVVGNYGGELMILKNFGNRTLGDFRQPKNLNDIVVKTAADGRLWGNLFSPAVIDWDRSGTPDFLIGDGGYSANNVFLFLNTGSGNAPRLSLENRFYLAYGEGREQLAPTVVDFNGDGHLDLLVGDRKGTVNLYLSKGPWVKGNQLEFSTALTFGGKDKLFNGCVSPSVADFNGDGLPDIIIGKTNGRIGLALNTGTKEQPKFDGVKDIKGVDKWNRSTMKNPSDWSIDFGKSRGNLLSYFTVVNAEDDPEVAPIPEGSNALKAGYFPSLNKFIRFHYLVVPASQDPQHGKANHIDTGWQGIGRTALNSALNADSNVLTIRKVFENKVIKPGKKYLLSFKHKGKGIRGGVATFVLAGHGKRSASKVQSTGGRGVSVTQDTVSESVFDTTNFNVSPAWASVNRPISLSFKNKDLNSDSGFIEPANYQAALEIRVTVNQGDGIVYFDDIQLVEQ